MEKCIISACTGGLGNRLKCLISSMRIAAKLSLKLFVYWPLNNHCRCGFSELFENSIPEIDPKAYRRDAKYIYLSECLVDDNKFKNDVVINYSWRFILFPDEKISRSHVLPFLPGYDGKGIDFKYQDTPSILKKDFLYYVNSLIPKKVIMEKVSEFAQQFDADTVSVQLRTWRTGQALDFHRYLLFSSLPFPQLHNILFLASDSFMS